MDQINQIEPKQNEVKAKNLNWTPWLIVLLSALTVLLGFNYKFRPWDKPVIPEQGPVVEVSPSPTPARQLSSAEQVGQVLAFPLVVDGGSVLASDSAELASLEQIKPGVVTIFGSNISVEELADARRRLAASSAEWPVWPILAVDHEGGRVQRLNGVGYTRLTSWQALCALSDAQRQQSFAQTSQELASSGIKLVFGPVVDLATPSGLLGSRTCTDNLETLTLISNDLIDIYRKDGILATIKHFPGIGSSTVDLHYNFQILNLRAEDVEPFRRLLTLKPDLAVMISHVGIKDLYNSPCSLTPDCVGSLASEHPEALLVTDALDMKSVFNGADPAYRPQSLAEAAEMALRAGNHVLVFGQGTTAEEMVAVHQYLLDLYQTDPTFAARIDAAVLQLEKYRKLDWFQTAKMIN